MDAKSIDRRATAVMETPYDFAAQWLRQAEYAMSCAAAGRAKGLTHAPRNYEENAAEGYLKAVHRHHQADRLYVSPADALRIAARIAERSAAVNADLNSR